MEYIQFRKLVEVRQRWIAQLPLALSIIIRSNTKYQVNKKDYDLLDDAIPYLKDQDEKDFFAYMLGIFVGQLFIPGLIGITPMLHYLISIEKGLNEHFQRQEFNWEDTEMITDWLVSMTLKGERIQEGEQLLNDLLNPSAN